MPGGASTRRYFRLDLGNRTAVAMFVPGPPTHEIHKDPAAAVAKRWPYLEVCELLSSRKIRVPGVYADGTSDGWLVNAAEAMRLFGYPGVPLARLVDWTADWVARGMPSLGKDTHYDTRDGNF